MIRPIVLMYRKLLLSIIDNFAIFGVIELSVFVAKIISITHDNVIFQHLNKIAGFQQKINIFLKNSIFIRNKSNVWSPEILEIFSQIAMKTIVNCQFSQ
jgi:hypothetical protein